MADLCMCPITEIISPVCSTFNSVLSEVSQPSCPPGSYWLDMLWCWHQTVYPRPCCCWSLIDILTQFYTGHYNVSSTEERGGDNRNISWIWQTGGGGRTSDIFPGDISLNAGVTTESPLLHGPHPASLSLSLTSSMWATFKFQGGGRSGESKGWGRREKRRSNWTNEWAASLDLDQRGDSWQLERGIDVTFFSNKNCIIAEWAGAGEWRGAVGNLDRVCGARKNFADVLIKNLTTN